MIGESEVMQLALDWARVRKVSLDYAANHYVDMISPLYELEYGKEVAKTAYEEAHKCMRELDEQERRARRMLYQALQEWL